MNKEKLFPNAVYANGPRLLRARHEPRLPQGQVPAGRPEDVGGLLGRQEVPRQPLDCYNHPVRADAPRARRRRRAADKVFPMDVDRAFKKLDQIKPHIKVWWTQGNQSQQLLRDGEVDMMVMWNARASELAQQGVPVELVWHGATITTTMWGVAKGAPNREARPGSSSSSPCSAKPQADFANRLFYGPTNPEAFKFIPPEVARQLPTYPENAKVAISPTPCGRRSTPPGSRSASRSGSPRRQRAFERDGLAAPGSDVRGPRAALRDADRLRAAPERHRSRALARALSAHLHDAALHARARQHLPHVAARDAGLPASSAIRSPT